MENKKTIEQKLEELKKTIEFKWRVQSLIPNKTAPKEAIMIPYVDARDVQDRLDDVIGASGWQNKYEQIGASLHCNIGIKIYDEWVWKSDRGLLHKQKKKRERLLMPLNVLPLCGELIEMRTMPERLKFL